MMLQSWHPERPCAISLSSLAYPLQAGWVSEALILTLRPLNTQKRHRGRHSGSGAKLPKTNRLTASNLSIKGSFPFSNSGHAGGCNMVFCDGAVRFVSATLDSTVCAKIITPAGSKLPIYAKQLPVEQDSFAQ
jgi:prepilin-type processing-associated H-X9-DG protein